MFPFYRHDRPWLHNASFMTRSYEKTRVLHSLVQPLLRRSGHAPLIKPYSHCVHLFASTAKYGSNQTWQRERSGTLVIVSYHRFTGMMKSGMRLTIYQTS